MIIRKYGIELRRLTANDIELVRAHRNSDAIRNKMFFREEISKEAQKVWFERINNSLHYYFLVNWKGSDVGLIHGKIISSSERATTGGVFFWDENVRVTYVPICASVIMADLTFLLLRMQSSTAVVRADNHHALQFNKKLGYKEVSREMNKVYLNLSSENYLHSELRKLVKRVTKDEKDLVWKDIYLSKEELRNEQGRLIPEFLNEYKKENNVDV